MFQGLSRRGLLSVYQLHNSLGCFLTGLMGRESYSSQTSLDMPALIATIKAHDGNFFPYLDMQTSSFVQRTDGLQICTKGHYRRAFFKCQGLSQARTPALVGKLCKQEAFSGHWYALLGKGM